MMWITKVIALTYIFLNITNDIFLSVILGFLIGTFESLLGEMWDAIKTTRLITAINELIKRNKQ